MTKQELLQRLQALKTRGALGAGRKEYALELAETLECTDVPRDFKTLRKLLLNGAKDWEQYSYGGCSLIYDEDICRRICTERVQKRKHYGELQPDGGRTWLDLQAAVLGQAFRMVWNVVKEGE